MTTLLFNSNYLHILIPSASKSAFAYRAGDTFTIRCVYDFWPVANLYQEWGIDDYPVFSATWAASFLAAPAPNNLRVWEDPRTKEGEWYWVALYPTKQPNQPIAALCLADADRLFFGVATNEEATSSLFTLPKPDNAEAWLQVEIEDIRRIETDEPGEEEEITAHIVIHGQTKSGWTKAIVEPISI